jgi:hypothetical protein
MLPFRLGGTQLRGQRATPAGSRGRDRFQDQVNGDAGLLLPSAKYEVVRALPSPGTASSPQFVEVKALPEAA